MVDVFTIEISIYAVLALKNCKWFLTNFHISVICNHQVAGTISSHGHIWLKDPPAHLPGDVTATIL